MVGQGMLGYARSHTKVVRSRAREKDRGGLLGQFRKKKEKRSKADFVYKNTFYFLNLFQIANQFEFKSSLNLQ
jgi:hypothetical protein